MFSKVVWMVTISSSGASGKDLRRSWCLSQVVHDTCHTFLSLPYSTSINNILLSYVFVSHFTGSQKACGNLVPIIYPSGIDRGLVLGQCESTACRAAGFCTEWRRFGISSSVAAPFSVALWWLWHSVALLTLPRRLWNCITHGYVIYSSWDSLGAGMHNKQCVLYVLLVKYSVYCLVLYKLWIYKMH